MMDLESAKRGLEASGMFAGRLLEVRRVTSEELEVIRETTAKELEEFEDHAPAISDAAWVRSSGNPPEEWFRRRHPFAPPGFNNILLWDDLPCWLRYSP